MTKFQVTMTLLACMPIAGCGHEEDFGRERPAPSVLVGAACNNDNDCEQYCAEGGDFPDGFCTLRCRDNDACPRGTVCINRQGGICLYPCGSSQDCVASFLGRAGYTCLTEPGFGDEDTSSVRYQVCIDD